LALLPEADRGGKDQDKTTIKKVVYLPLIYLSTEYSKEKLPVDKNLMIKNGNHKEKKYIGYRFSINFKSIP
jgi:hypothetical protein